MTRCAATLACLLWASTAAAQGVYFDTRSVLRSFFPDSQTVGYEKVRVADHRSTLRKLLGYVPPKAEYVVFVARTGEAIDGYAVIDDEKGQHLPITFATKLGPDGRVMRTEVMVYREGYGHEIREGRFRRQFVGKGPARTPTSGDDVVAISGATISSKSMAIAVKRSIAIVEVLRGTSESSDAAAAAN